MAALCACASTNESRSRFLKTLPENSQKSAAPRPPWRRFAQVKALTKAEAAS
jgi:hypothetical protein